MKTTYTIFYKDQFLWVSSIIAKEFNLQDKQRVHSEELFYKILRRNAEHNLLALQPLVDKAKSS